MGSPYSPSIEYGAPPGYAYPQPYDDDYAQMPPSMQPPPLPGQPLFSTPPPPPPVHPVNMPPSLQGIPPGYGAGGMMPPYGDPYGEPYGDPYGEPYGDPYMHPFVGNYPGMPPVPPMGPYGPPGMPPGAGMFGPDMPPGVIPPSGAFLNRFADMAVHDIIPPSELSQIVPDASDTNIDRDIAMMLAKAHKYGGALPGGHNSRRKYAKYVFLAGFLLAKRGYPSVAVPENPDDPWVKLLHLYMSDTSRLGTDPEQVLVNTLQKHRKGRHHHHHHHHRHRSSSRTRNDRSRSRGERSHSKGDRSRSRSRSRRSKADSCSSSTEWDS